MAQKSFWKGYLKLSLVTCPVELSPATSEAERIRFHILNARTGNRIASQYVDSETGKAIEEDDEVLGYERGDGDYILLERDEVDSIALESTRTIDIEAFVPATSIDWIWYDKPHFLTPRDSVGEEAFAVIRDAMASTATAGISRLVMYRRERAVMIVPRGRGMILWTLRYGDEVRDWKVYFAALGKAKVDPSALSLLRKLIAGLKTAWDPSMVRDPVQERLAELIAAKKKGRRTKKPPRETDTTAPSNVINIMDALRKSLKGTPSRR
jgi:DNA end-binding protein Ku